MEQNSEDDPSIHSAAFKTVLLRAAHYVAKTFSSQASANVFAAFLRNIDYIALLLQLINHSKDLSNKKTCIEVSTQVLCPIELSYQQVPIQIPSVRRRGMRLLSWYLRFFSHYTDVDAIR